MSESNNNNNNNTSENAGEKPLSKKELAKLAKKEKKAAYKVKDAEAAAAASSSSSSSSSSSAPAVEEESSTNCGDLPMIRSAEKKARTFTEVEKLDESLQGQRVLIRARVHNSRAKGNLCFVVLRQMSATVQAVLEKSSDVNKFMLKFVAAIPKESIVEVEGTVRPAKVDLCTQKTVEISVSSVWVVSRSVTVLPLLPEDAARPQAILDDQEATIKSIDSSIEAVSLDTALDAKQKQAKTDELLKQKAAAQKYVVVGQEVRLDNRVLDLRTPANQAIFRVQSAVCQLWRDLLIQEGFVEIHSPKIIGAASEGGASVFKLQYFEGNAYLAQSPQFYKQMAVCGDFEKVFEIGSVFRAENANTHRHMTEFMGLDMEMAFKDHYHEVLDVLDKLFVNIFEGLEKKYARELEVVDQQYPFAPLQYLKPTLRLTFPEAVALLRAHGTVIDDLCDLSTPQEKELGRLVKEKYKTDFYILDKFPSCARPFYTMKDPLDERYANAYDIFLRGEEISSGAQRIHDADMLLSNAKAHGIDPATIQPYIDAFKYGAPPHAGCGVGLERFVMLYLGLHNIRKTSLFPRDPKRVQP
eukprot:TRINITY_DN1909_c0_g1_i1.p1 TRINITY_DN1909_c0_g1~~TRINITY_DN1909_c0_g1_i1.p1  ORF type:complete len:599 (-),score=224.21 TRINITY_DN1909_c0_g1_i1:59-1807(-)